MRKQTKQKLTEQEMLKDIGKGTSQWPSDNPSPLTFNEIEWRWIDAVYAADKNCEPARLIELMARSRVPKRVMPYIARLLLARVGRKRGRPLGPQLPTRKAITYYLAQLAVRELVEEFGGPVSAAAKKVAPQWKLSARALNDYCTGRSGYSRRYR